MTSFSILNNIDHKDLKVNSERSAELGDAVMSTIAFTVEFRNIQADYPIVFSKISEVDYQPTVLFGFEPGENLYLNGNTWDASYVPLMIEKGPFYISKPEGDDAESVNENMLISIDTDSPRFSTAEGEALFLPHGGNSDYTENIASILNAIHEGTGVNQKFIAALLKYGLLESFVFDVQLNDGSKHRLAGFFTINEDTLAELPSEAIDELHEQGFLRDIYMVIASLSNLRNLVEKKNAQS